MFEQYLQYITNVGGEVDIRAFDVDWSPIGPQLRKAMHEAGLIEYVHYLGGRTTIIRTEI
jgi:hypothetical protein